VGAQRGTSRYIIGVYHVVTDLITLSIDRATKGWYQAVVNITGDDSHLWDNMLTFMKKSFSLTPPDIRYRAANASVNLTLSAFDVP
jgi:hypothetical protein